MRYIADLGGPEQAESLVETARANPSLELVPLVVRSLDRWSLQGDSGAQESLRAKLNQAIADVQGSSGIPVRWRRVGPLSKEEAAKQFERLAARPPPSEDASLAPPDTAPAIFGQGADLRVTLPAEDAKSDAVWLAYTDVVLPSETAVQIIISASGKLRIGVNGLIQESLVFKSGDPPAQADRFDVVLPKGMSRLLVQLPADATAAFQVQIRRKSSAAALEKLAHAALTQAVNAPAASLDRGRRVFLDAEKSQCLKCHRLGDQGEKFGPELTGLGSRFSRIHIIESILEPSRTIASSFQTIQVVLADGRVVTGVTVAETDSTLTLVDSQAKKHVLAKAEIERQQTHAASTMPDGLEKRLTEQEFIDLVAFLSSQTAAANR